MTRPNQTYTAGLAPFWDAITVSGWQGGRTPNGRNEFGQTPLMWALRHWPPGVAPLLNAGADVQATSSAGCTALMVAHRWCAAYVSILCAHGAVLPGSEAGGGGQTAPKALLNHALLLHALQYDPSQIRACLEQGCGVNLVVQGRVPMCTPLMAAARWHPTSVPLLLELEADVHVRNFEGTTALMVACEHQGSAVPALLRAGASVCDFNNGQESPLLLAMSCQPSAVLPLLEAGATPADLRSRWIRARRAEPYHPESVALLSGWKMGQAITVETPTKPRSRL